MNATAIVHHYFKVLNCSDESNSRADDHKALIIFDRVFCKSDRTVYGMPCFSKVVIAPLIKDRNDCTCCVFVLNKHCDFHFTPDGIQHAIVTAGI